MVSAAQPGAALVPSDQLPPMAGREDLLCTAPCSLARLLEGEPEGPLRTALRKDTEAQGSLA